MIDIHSPGKLMLSGEYAVLEGAPAVLCPSHHQVHVHIGFAEEHHIVRSVTIDDNPALFHLEDTQLVWDCDEAMASRMDLIRCVVETLLVHRQIRPDMPLCDILIDSREFIDEESGQKFGVGSSAAVSVSLVRALLQWNCRAMNDRLVFNLAAKAHARFQSGRGSQADVAACTYNELICYQSKRTSIIPWPDELYCAAIWTGESVSTSSFLSRLEMWSSNQPVSYYDKFNSLKDSAVEIADAFINNQASTIVRLLEDYSALLEAIGQEAEIPIISTRHQYIRSLATDAALRYKPSGAGGGDYGLVFTQHRDLLERFMNQLSDHNLRHSFMLQSDRQSIAS